MPPRVSSFTDGGRLLRGDDPTGRSHTPDQRSRDKSPVKEKDKSQGPNLNPTKFKFLDLGSSYFGSSSSRTSRSREEGDSSAEGT